MNKICTFIKSDYDKQKMLLLPDISIPQVFTAIIVIARFA
jgi:hypothetical protein